MINYKYKVKLSQIKVQIKLFIYFQVNMMSAQMLASAGSVAGTVSDLAPGAKDGMRMLEARAVAMNKEEQMSTSVAPSAAGNERNT